MDDVPPRPDAEGRLVMNRGFGSCGCLPSGAACSGSWPWQTKGPAMPKKWSVSHACSVAWGFPSSAAGEEGSSPRITYGVEQAVQLHRRALDL